MEKVKVKFSFCVEYSDAEMNAAAQNRTQFREAEMTEDEYQQLEKGGKPAAQNYILHTFYGNDRTRAYITAITQINFHRAY